MNLWLTDGFNKYNGHFSISRMLKAIYSTCDEKCIHVNCNLIAEASPFEFGRPGSRGSRSVEIVLHSR